MACAAEGVKELPRPFIPADAGIQAWPKTLAFEWVKGWVPAAALVGAHISFCRAGTELHSLAPKGRGWGEGATTFRIAPPEPLIPPSPRWGEGVRGIASLTTEIYASASAKAGTSGRGFFTGVAARLR
jgi:hypothetical protein